MRLERDPRPSTIADEKGADASKPRADDGGAQRAGLFIPADSKYISYWHGEDEIPYFAIHFTSATGMRNIRRNDTCCRRSRPAPTFYRGLKALRICVRKRRGA